MGKCWYLNHKTSPRNPQVLFTKLNQNEKN